MTEPASSLVSCEWLRDRLGDRRLILLDASWYLPAAKRNPDAEFAECHIPGAQRFDFDAEVKDHTSSLPHMLPSAADFETHARGLGINSDSRIVIYDTAGLFAAARAWWMFKAMGHQEVFVLSGGLPAWIECDGPLESGPPVAAKAGEFRAHAVPSRIARLDDVREAILNGGSQIADARSAARFSGREPEPRPGLRSGHMPGAINLPFDQVLRDRRYKPAAELRATFESAGLIPALPMIASCGSGVTACILALGAEVAGLPPVAVYDGSWAEWGMPGDPTLAIVTDMS